jgi:hypothetical protein
MNENHLFKLKVAEKERIGMKFLDLNMSSNPYAAPDLIPISSDQPGSPGSPPQIINVIKDFRWTHTPSIGRNEVPRLKMSEYKVEFNSVIQQLRYLLTAQGEGNKEMGTKVMNALAKGGTAISDMFSTNGVKAAADGAKAADGNPMPGHDAHGDPAGGGLPKTPAPGGKAPGGKPVKSIGEHIEELKNRVTNAVIGEKEANFKFLVSPPESMLNDTPWLVPYWGLYGVRPTGFQYILPYFNEAYKSVNQTWGELRGGGMFTTLLRDLPAGMAQNITKNFETVAKGAFIDLPKSYHYDQATNPELKFNLYLYNTDNFGDVVKNWELVFMLIYQNLANKTSKILLEPPVLYEVEVDGLHYLPYAYISSLTVVNHGTEREMTIPILIDEKDKLHQQFAEPPYGNIKPSRDLDKKRRHGTTSRANEGKKMAVQEAGSSGTSPDPQTRGIVAQIPEAWEIQINFKSLLPETKNLMFHAITKSQDIYEVQIQKPGEAEEIIAGSRNADNKKGEKFGGQLNNPFQNTRFDKPK